MLAAALKARAVCYAALCACHAYMLSGSAPTHAAMCGWCMYRAFVWVSPAHPWCQPAGGCWLRSNLSTVLAVMADPNAVSGKLLPTPNYARESARSIVLPGRAY